jgi:membrane protease YdiL (CAAX protease family)
MQPNPSNGVERIKLPLFFLLSFLISWVVWVPQAAGTLGITGLAIPVDSPLNLFAVWGPALAAIIVAALTAGRTGLRKLLGSLGQWRVGIEWYVLILLLPAGIWLAGRVLDMVLGRSYELESVLSQVGPQYTMMLPFFMILALPSALGEEIGWRGFALPRLQARNSAYESTIILGVLWAVWHIPHNIGQGQTGTPLFVGVLSILPLTVLFTWVYNSTRGSLLLAWLFHAAQIITGYLLAPLPTYSDDLFLWIVAIVVGILAGPANLSRQQKVTA